MSDDLRPVLFWWQPWLWLLFSYFNQHYGYLCSPARFCSFSPPLTSRMYSLRSIGFLTLTSFWPLSAPYLYTSAALFDCVLCQGSEGGNFAWSSAVHLKFHWMFSRISTKSYFSFLLFLSFLCDVVSICGSTGLNTLGESRIISLSCKGTNYVFCRLCMRIFCGRSGGKEK